MGVLRINSASMGEEIAISLKNVSKCYKRYARPVDRLKEILLPGKSRTDEFWALRDIGLEMAVDLIQNLREDRMYFLMDGCWG